MIDEKKLKGIVSNFEEREKARLEAEEKRKKLDIKEMKELRMACKRVFATVNGKIVARGLMKVSGIYNMRKNNNNLYEIGKERGKEELYLFFVKGMLNGDLVAEIERKIEKEDF